MSVMDKPAMLLYANWLIVDEPSTRFLQPMARAQPKDQISQDYIGLVFQLQEISLDALLKSGYITFMDSIGLR